MYVVTLYNYEEVEIKADGVQLDALCLLLTLEGVGVAAFHSGYWISAKPKGLEDA
jgi:hypothetical protein